MFYLALTTIESYRNQNWCFNGFYLEKHVSVRSFAIQTVQDTEMSRIFQCKFLAQVT